MPRSWSFGCCGGSSSALEDDIQSYGAQELHVEEDGSILLQDNLSAPLLSLSAKRLEKATQAVICKMPDSSPREQPFARRSPPEVEEPPRIGAEEMRARLKVESQMPPSPTDVESTEAPLSEVFDDISIMDMDEVAPGCCSSERVNSMQFLELEGSWVLDRVEGDMEALMMDGKVPWSTRIMARKFHYGVGRVVHRIQHQDGYLAITIQGGLTNFEVRLDLSGAGLESVCEQGHPASLLASTDGHRLVVTGHSKKDGSTLQNNARFRQGEELVQAVYPNQGDYVVKRFFKRKS